jgi:DNA-binding transcriptional LysR family regulator
MGRRHPPASDGAYAADASLRFDALLMNLRFVEAFYWVATLKSVTRAAEKLSLTQSAMSSRIATLEEELGVMLLDRRDRQFRLTTPGSRFLVHAQRLLELQREVKAEMGSGAEQAAPLRLGAIESVLHSWLIPWVEAFRVDRPWLALELTVETTPMLIEQIRRGTLDLAFAALPAAGEGIRTRALPPMEMVFVANSNIHKRARCSLTELAGNDFLTFQRGSQPHVALLDLFRTVKLEPKRVHAVSSISAMTQLVEGGFGIATLPRSAANRLLKHRELRILTTEPPLPPLDVFASYRSDAASHSVEAIVKSAIAFAENELPSSRSSKRLAGPMSKSVPRSAPKTASKKSMSQSK